MKSISVGQLRRNPTAMLAEVEAGDTYLVTREDRGIARIVPMAIEPLPPRTRVSGSRLAHLPRHELTTAATIDELLADERGR